ncbi:pyridoxal-phosphate dependent enzyme [Marivita geojedonensis]|uniref:Diaminopropionate ammonia-lyase n=1 Tax=Marivita geojedonensis TaxID=1123756 RepID=A0A1X4NPS9_9RHOB|nr:pyridoxal-phosphate dependent enzyme [Marivita geojedonensis]OSQ52674.1 diaminopropionate ammonia-lyase [Marivita geojedonensis]PRY80887.1 diaminopropionate ammonia-lyase [Marivita geojedonensis]
MEIHHKTEAERKAVLDVLADVPFPSVNADRPAGLLKRCPAASVTPLVDAPELASRAGVAHVQIKDERERMDLGSFKALGAAYVIAQDAETGAAKGQTYVTASAGNHGLSVAAGAQAFGAHAVVYLAETVPEGFADRLRGFGAEVVRQGAIYEEAMAAAAQAAKDRDWALLSDSSWPGYFDRPHVLMEGYLVLMQEAVSQMPAPPTHIFLQAGVGGLAAAAAAYARKAWGDAPRIIVVEPEVAPALFASVVAGSPQITAGPESAMGRLDCKEPSLIALKGLSRDADDFMLITESEGATGSAACAEAGLPTSPSGAAGYAGLLAARDSFDALGLSDQSRVLVVLSEQAA